MPLYDEPHNLNKAADVQIKAETISPNNILTEIDQNLPAKVCPAHSLLVLYIQDLNKLMKEDVKRLEDKIDDLTTYVRKEQGKDEEKDKNKKENDKNKDNTFKTWLTILSAILNILSSIILAYVFIYLQLK